MLDTQEIERIIQDQIKIEINDYVTKTLSSKDWVTSIENTIVTNVQSQLLNKLSDISSLPEIAKLVEQKVVKVFDQGHIPGIDHYVKPENINYAIDQTVEKIVDQLVDSLSRDEAWLEKIEKLINQAVVQRTVGTIASIDINTVIHQRVDENLETVHKKFMKNFSSNGIADKAESLQLVVLDETVVIENELVTKNLNVVENTTVKDLTVTGSINTDNRSWHNLAQVISQRTLSSIDSMWTDKLVNQVVETIQQKGINFDRVTINNEPLLDGNKLNNTITDTNIQKLGQLRSLQVKGEAHINDTVSIINHRVGINTTTPESAFSIWDEEVSVIIGKYRAKQAYIGTSRDQSLALGVNRQALLEIDSSGLTRVKKLQVGLHKISHDSQVPGWSGTRGDIVFNNSPGSDRVFAWVCLGAHKWQTLKSAE